MEKYVERDRKIEKELIKELAIKVQDYEFIKYALNHMDSLDKKRKLIQWLKSNSTATKKEIERYMFFITTGIEI